MICLDKRRSKDEKEQIMLKSIEGTYLSRVDFDDMEDIRKILDKI